MEIEDWGLEIEDWRLETTMVTLTIDGQEVQIEEGKTVLEAAREAGIEIPTLCYHPDLTPYGACRVCVVEVFRNGHSQVTASCTLPAREGMKVETRSPRALQTRRAMVELLWARCPNVPVLQRMAEELGIEKPRFPSEHPQEDCILCGLCVRACDEIAGKKLIGFVGRGTERRVSTPFDRAYDECVGCDICIPYCPTGAISNEGGARLKDISRKAERLTQGHRLCAGCAAPIIVRQILNAIDEPVVLANATGCLEVSTTIYPYTAWAVPWIHNAFENAASTISGVEAAYRSLVRQGKIADRNIKFIAFGGDGGTYDIGIQALSGAMERGHKMMYVCYDNQAYMNTGIQRSGATPYGASTTTSPAGKVIPGKQQFHKDLTAIAVAHNIPYVAQSSPSHWRDLMNKARKGVAVDGPAFLNVLSSCNRGWRHETGETIEIMRLAVETCFWPLFEVENGVYKLNYKPKEKLPVEEWLRRQGRFRHLFTPRNRHVIDELQAEVDRRWEKLLKLCCET